MIPIIIGTLGTVPKGMVKRLEDRNQKTSGYHLNYSIVNIGQNIEKSLGDLRRFAVTQNQVKNQKLTRV